MKTWVQAILVALSIASNTNLHASDAKPFSLEEGTKPGRIKMYQPNYLLPYYYTRSPYDAIYYGTTPNDQPIQQEEFKAQLSLMLPIIKGRLWHKRFYFDVAYTQLMYWQFYARSQYFRETNYEPEAFFQLQLHPSWQSQLGVDHQSNGRGGLLERSWNRMYIQLQYNPFNILVRERLWTLIAKADSSNLHNPDIAYYLGYDNLILSRKLGDLTASLEMQNIASGLRRGFVIASLSYPLFSSLALYGQVFSGYGQSLIEYNHRTTSLGIGVSIKDWL